MSVVRQFSVVNNLLFDFCLRSKNGLSNRLPCFSSAGAQQGKSRS